jgi:putative Ca2+/H+ antiporter (TMEM165/GDT1 family)
LFNIFLITHIVTGVICLISGVTAMSSKKKRGKHTFSGEIYHWAYVLVFISAVVMSIVHWEDSAYLFYIGIFSYALALLGYSSSKMRWKNWLGSHIGGMLGSYIGIVTATIVVNVPKMPVLNELPSLLFWLLPTIIGTPFIFRVGNKYKPIRTNI